MRRRDFRRTRNGLWLLPTTVNAPQIFQAMGDSLTAGYSLGAGGATDATKAWPYLVYQALTANSWPAPNNDAVSGDTITQCNTAAASTTDTRWNAGYTKQLLVFWAGTNDIEDTFATGINTLDQLQRNTQQFIYNRRQATNAGNVMIFIATCISRNWTSGTIGVAAKEALRVAWNSFLTTLDTASGLYGWQVLGADGLMDFAGDSRIGAPAAYNSTTYFQWPDVGAQNGIHLTAAGQSIVAGIAQTAIQNLAYGHQAPTMTGVTDFGRLLRFYRADLGITTATGVSRARDYALSAIADDIRQATGAKQPTLNTSDAAYNNRPTFQSTAGAQGLSTVANGSVSQTCTIYVVGQLTGGTGNPELVDATSGVSRIVLAASASGLFPVVYANNLVTEASNPVSSPCVFWVVASGATSKIGVSAKTPQFTNQNIGTSAMAGVDLFGLVQAAVSIGKVAELRIYNGDETSIGNHNAIMTELGSRYGISIAA